MQHIHSPAKRSARLRAMVIFALSLVSAGSTASAQNVDPTEREISLVRQDQSDCANGDVSDRDPSLIGGTIWLTRGTDGITRVRVAMTASPNTTYHFYLKCVRQLGDIRTFDEGEGFGTFEFANSSVGNIYGFDMYPEGAPPGKKYQSVQVRF